MPQFMKAVPFAAFQFVMPVDKNMIPDDGEFWELESFVEEAFQKDFSGITVNGIYIVDTKNPNRFEHRVKSFNTRYGAVISIYVSGNDNYGKVSFELNEGEWFVENSSSEHGVVVITDEQFNDLRLK